MQHSRQALEEAEKKAAILFEEIEKRGFFSAGKTEKELNEEVFALAYELFGIEKYWHKRIVRAGSNTLLPYDENPPNRTLESDDILFLDFGPIFEEWEADFGRTYVLGSHPDKIRLKENAEAAWKEGQSFFLAHKNAQKPLTGAEMYQYACQLATRYGWDFGGEIAGHIVGHFPHEKLDKALKDNYIHPENHQNLFAPDKSGQERHWILEIHFVDRTQQIGAFFEQLL